MMNDVKVYDAREQAEPYNGRRPYTLAATIERMIDEVEAGVPTMVRLLDTSGRVAVPWAIYHYSRASPFKVKAKRVDDLYVISKVRL